MCEETMEALARAVDLRVLELPEGCDPARMFGVRKRGSDFVLVPFWSGVGREMPIGITPPDGCCAIAFESGGWAAPLDDDVGVTIRPSQHPARRRMHSTTVMYGEGGADITIVRCADEPPQVMRDGVGVIPELMRACWESRRDDV